MKTIRLAAALLLFSSMAGVVRAADGEDISKTFSVNKGGTLKVNLMLGDITIDTWNKNEVSVSIGDVDEDQQGMLNIYQSGNNVTVQFNGSGSHGESDVRITVPSEYNLNLETNKGEVQLSNYIKGSVRIDTRSGDITLAGVNGDLKVLTNGGDITLSTITGNANATTYGGDITAGNVTGSLALTTMGGDIHTQNISNNANLNTKGGTIIIKNVGGDLNAETNGGDVMVEDVGGDAIISTLGGSINVKKVSGSAELKTNGGNITLLSANRSISARTFGGNITLHNISGIVNANTNSGDIYIELKSIGSGTSSLTSMNGGVKLYIDPSAKATINALTYGVQYGESINDYIKSDFPIKRSGSSQYGGSIKAAVNLNGGGTVINIRSENAGIEIRKLRK